MEKRIWRKSVACRSAVLTAHTREFPLFSHVTAHSNLESLAPQAPERPNPTRFWVLAVAKCWKKAGRDWKEKKMQWEKFEKERLTKPNSTADNN